MIILWIFVLFYKLFEFILTKVIYLLHQIWDKIYREKNGAYLKYNIDFRSKIILIALARREFSDYNTPRI